MSNQHHRIPLQADKDDSSYTFNKHSKNNGVSTGNYKTRVELNNFNESMRIHEAEESKIASVIPQKHHWEEKEEMPRINSDVQKAT